MVRKDPKAVAAKRLWQQARSGLLNTEQALVNIIRSRAWEPLGHESFSKAWVEEMADVTLAIELRPHVVYQLIDEGLTIDEIADAVKGVGPIGAAALKRQKNNGVPAELATVKGRAQKRAPLPYVRLYMRVPRQQMAAWQRKARRDGTTVEDFAYAVVAKAFGEV